MDLKKNIKEKQEKQELFFFDMMKKILQRLSKKVLI